MKLIVTGILRRFFGLGFEESRVDNQDAKKIDLMKQEFEALASLSI
jgi:hypothetical protein